jgi:hypothetical protein
MRTTSLQAPASPASSGLSRRIASAVLLAVLLAPAGAADDTRYQQYSLLTQGSGGRVRMVAATYLGRGAHELVGAAFTPDGHVLAFGNAWGPTLDLGAPSAVWGPDNYRPAPIYADPVQRRLDRDNPNLSGFVVRLGGELQHVEAVARSGWGGATISGGQIGSDGALYLTGVARDPFAGWARGQSGAKTGPPAGAKAGGRALYLMRLSGDLQRVEWVALFDGAEAAAADSERHAGGRLGLRFEALGERELVVMAYGRLYRLGTDGNGLTDIGAARGGALLGADARTGVIYLGGDENTKTGRESWRRPFLTALDRSGGVKWDYWRWDPKLVGDDKYRLVSDSSVRGVVPLGGPRLLVWGWSDGGNSVFLRQPTNLDADLSLNGGFINSLWGAGAGSFGWLMNVDTEKAQTVGETCVCSFLKNRNLPSSSRIDGACALDGGQLAIVGTSAFAFVETPDAWVKTFPDGGSGPYVAIYDELLSTLRFATLLPGLDGPLSVSRLGRRFVIAGSAPRPAPPTPPTPVLRPLWPQIGDEVDGWLLVGDTG